MPTSSSSSTSASQTQSASKLEMNKLFNWSSGSNPEVEGGPRDYLCLPSLALLAKPCGRMSFFFASTMCLKVEARKKISLSGHNFF